MKYKGNAFTQLLCAIKNNNMKKNILSFIILFLTSVHLMGQWTSINSGTTDNLVYITFPDSLNGYIIGSDLFGDGFLLKTSDGGYTWNQILYIEVGVLIDLHRIDISVRRFLLNVIIDDCD